MGQNYGSRESGIAAGNIVFIIVVITLAASVTLYLLAPNVTTTGGENIEMQVRHIVNSDTGEANVGTGVSNVAPNFVDATDSTFSLTGLRDKVVVLDFMATWCGPCVQEMSHLKEIFLSYSTEQVVIISIDVDPTESDETIKQFKAAYCDNWVFASGPDVGTTYGSVYIPTLYIIDKQGVIAYKNVGLTSSSTLSTEIDKLL